MIVASDVRGHVPSTIIDCSIASSGWVPVGECNRLVDTVKLQVQSTTTAVLNKLLLTVSAVVIHPDTGN